MAVLAPAHTQPDKGGLFAGYGRWALTQAARQGDRWPLWSPVAAGGALYLGLAQEPGLMVCVLPPVILIAAALLARSRAWPRPLIILVCLAAFAAAGFAAGKLRTLSVAAPVAVETGAVPITGWVVDVANPSENGGRLLIAPVAIGGMAAEDLPALIRVTAGENLYGPGAAIRFTGLLNPPPPPASPGGYDFARNAFFDGIGGSGVALTQPVAVSLPAPNGALAWKMRINGMRWALSHRIAAKMSPTARGLGVAMVTGHEAWIDGATEQDLRDSGLAHIVSISGLHMAIVGGFAFFLARGLIALWPWAALRVSGKKLAALFGLLAVGTYLVVSGAPPPAIRAAITASVAFVAILADRRAITLHALAVAALIIIFLQPEAVAEPGFQMSFCATAALVALAQAWPKRPREINTPWPIRMVQSFAFWLGVSLLASLVAGMATGPFAMQHFNRVAVFGLAANMASQPLSTFLMMPSLALGAALEPFGLGGPFLASASFAIDTLQTGAGWFAARPGSVLIVASAPGIALPIAFVGVLWVCLWKGPGRWLGLPAALAVALWPRPEPPVAWVDNEGAQAAIRVEGRLLVLRAETRLFGAEYWSRRNGLEPEAEDPELRARYFDCTGSGCRAAPGSSPRLSLWWTARRPSLAVLEDYCRSSDILVIRAEIDMPRACDQVRVLKPADFAAGGAMEVRADGSLVWAQPLRGARPWSLSGSGG